MDSIDTLESAIRALAPEVRARVLYLLQRSIAFDEIRAPAAAYEVSPSSGSLSVEEYLRLEEASQIRHEIASAIQGLPPADRRRLAERLLRPQTGIREPAAAAYGANVEHPCSTVSVEDYLRAEEQGTVRHEYINGALFAMSGASEAHNLIAGNLFAALHGHLHGRPCRTYMADFKVRLQVDRKDVFYYPDVMVACRPDGIERYYLRYPKLVIEVLSPSTASIDLREKRIHYASIESLEEYVIVSQEDFEVLHHARAAGWIPRHLLGRDAILELRSVGLNLPLAAIFDRALAAEG